MISIHDKPDIVKNKISKAFCPVKQVSGNPILEICKYVIFPELKDEKFLIKRPDKFGGDIEFSNYIELEQLFVTNLHPLDLKNSITDYINQILSPVHKYFENHNENLNKMKELGIIKS